MLPGACCWCCAGGSLCIRNSQQALTHSIPCLRDEAVSPHQVRIALVHCHCVIDTFAPGDMTKNGGGGDKALSTQFSGPLAVGLLRSRISQSPP